MVNLKHGFGRAGDGVSSIPTSAEISEVRVLGNEVEHGHASTVADGIGRGVSAGQINAVGIFADTQQEITKIAPGGRSPDEVDPSLLEGRQQYAPKPLFE